MKILVPEPPRAERTEAWVACSIAEFGHVGQQRHRIYVNPWGGYVLTTHCGASASVAGIWRKNTTKPKCAECESKR